MSDQKDDQQLHTMRHSTAHTFATAVKRLWPTVKLGVGPAVDNGFYYDLDLGDVTLSEEDFSKIEAEMKKVVAGKQEFVRSYKAIDEAIEWAKASGQPYKQELLNDLKRAGTTVAKELDAEELGVEAGDESKVDKVSFYTNGDFTDLCRGPHVESTAKIGAFKLMRVSGVYWRGKDTNPQMQRVYGVAFANEKELRQHLAMLEEAKKRDHRKLGQELDLFVFSDLIGAGLPLWTPRGTTMRKEIDRFVQEIRDEFDFQEVAIPHITKKDAYIKSGHWNKFKDELFRMTTREGHEFAMKPMNCPHHTQIYDSRPRSYRELPIRYRETTMVYRDEQTGELTGLSRVRAITQDDAHVFCRVSQIKQEIENAWEIVERFYGAFGIPLRVRLSRHDPANMEKYLGASERWETAEAQLKEIIEAKGVEYFDGLGEAAFYGPKIDFIGTDVLGREFQASTIQLDFGQPEGFDLNCIDEKGDKERVVMIHCAVSGSLERCLVLLIEHYGGKFPAWLSPEQIRLITVNQETATTDFANKLKAQAKKLGLRVTIDNDNESVGKKIRNAELMKVPYTLVLGEKEIETGMLTPRIRKDMEVNPQTESRTIEEFLKTVANEVKSRVSKTSL